MDQPECITLLATLTHVPDPRKARGQRYAWHDLLVIIATALLSEQRTPHAIAHWAQLHAASLRRRLHFHCTRIPSESTLRRTLRVVDLAALEHALSHFTHALDHSAPPTTQPTPQWRGQAVDGKTVRGTSAYEKPLHLVSLVRHTSACVLAQTAVATKSNEIRAVPALLAGRAFHGTVTTMDALLTQAPLAQQILDQYGQYLMVVKRNQPQLYAELDLLFATPALPIDAAMYAQYQTLTKGHGRLERRTLVCSTALCGYVEWPSVGQVLKRTCERTVLKTGRTSVEVTYGITSLTPADASPAQVEALWRGHWTIENKLHYVRDVTLGEDAGQAHAEHTPHALAALRNAIVSLVRWRGWTNVADALRTYNASIHEALSVVGVPPG